MSKVTFMTGDIFETEAHGIGHGVNVEGLMGAGIAVQFKNRLPEMYRAYQVLCSKGNLKPGETMVWDCGGGYYVYNIASQDRPGRHASLEWLQEGVEAALSHADAHGVDRIALPRIGAGIGGLKWDDALKAIVDAASASKADIEVWTLPYN